MMTSVGTVSVQKAQLQEFAAGNFVTPSRCDGVTLGQSDQQHASLWDGASGRFLRPRRGGFCEAATKASPSGLG